MSIILNKYVGGIPTESLGNSLQMCEVVPVQTNTENHKVSNGYYCMVIDNSGSMNSAATVTTDDGDKVNHGWSTLDIAKHSMNTFIQSLDEVDHVKIITYSDMATTVADWTVCGDHGKETLQRLLYSIQPDRATNMIAGLEKGFQAFNEVPVSDEMGYHLLFTTDGMPSSQFLPVRGIGAFKQMVNNLVDNQKQCGRNINVTTLGLGNHLNSVVLMDICAGTGEFLHVTDPGCVGPFMVNLVGQFRSISRIPGTERLSTNMYLRISPETKVLGYEGLNMVETRDGDTWVNLKHLIYDTPRHIVVQNDERLQFGLYQKLPTGQFVRIPVTIPTEPLVNPELVTYHGLRQFNVEFMSNYLTSETLLGTMKDAMESHIIHLSNVWDALGPMAGPMKNTIVNELMLGFSTSENFLNWGRHYARTLIPHLLRELRTNFRDEIMGSFILDVEGRDSLFEKESNKAETIFATMTPPPPSLLAPPSRSYGALAAPTILPDEYMRGGGCFHPDNKVKRWAAHGWEEIEMSRIRAGDNIATEGWGIVKVKCVVYINCPGEKAEFVKLGDDTNPVYITPWHPIRVDGKWVFPKDYVGGETTIEDTPYVINLVLEDTHIIQMSGYSAVTLGHGFQEDVVRHKFWGGDVIVVLSLEPGWAWGSVTLAGPLIPERRPKIIKNLSDPLLLEENGIDQKQLQLDKDLSRTLNRILRVYKCMDMQVPDQDLTPPAMSPKILNKCWRVDYALNIVNKHNAAVV
jgi:hypothetical protein